jgi:5'-nucleotidase (lipoprotein e(P4) family)
MCCAKISGEFSMLKMSFALLATICAVGTFSACSPRSDTFSGPHPGILWARDAAEFDAISIQVYRAASDNLARLIADRSWTAMPGQTSYGQLPPAIIFDIDETLVSNADFQASLEPPFSNDKLHQWNANNKAVATPGAAEFVRLAREHGVELFFLTNRPCEILEGVAEPCAQEAVAVQDLVEAGIPADADHVMLANEKPAWDREKLSRRNRIAQDYRIIMLIGDDLSDFIPCVRKKVYAPCSEAATAASRQKQTELYRNYWGAGWFVLPNPMHGSWTSFE